MQGSTLVAKCIYECVKLAGIAMIFIPGSVEYVGVSNIVAYVKNKHKNVDQPLGVFSEVVYSKIPHIVELPISRCHS